MILAIASAQMCVRAGLVRRAVLKPLVVSDSDALDEDRRDRVVEYWEDFLEMTADEGQHDRILKDCQQMPR